MINHDAVAEQIFEELFNHTTEYYPLLLIPTGPVAWGISNKTYIADLPYKPAASCDYYCIYFTPASLLLGFQQRRKHLLDSLSDYSEPHLHSGLFHTEYGRATICADELGDFITRLALPRSSMQPQVQDIEAIYSPYIYKSDALDSFEPWLKRYMEDHAITILVDYIFQRCGVPLGTNAALLGHYLRVARLLVWYEQKSWLDDVPDALHVHSQLASSAIIDTIKNGYETLDMTAKVDEHSDVFNAILTISEHAQSLCNKLDKDMGTRSNVDKETADVLENKLIEFRQATI